MGKISVHCFPRSRDRATRENSHLLQQIEGVLVTRKGLHEKYRTSDVLAEEVAVGEGEDRGQQADLREYSGKIVGRMRYRTYRVGSVMTVGAKVSLEEPFSPPFMRIFPCLFSFTKLSRCFTCSFSLLGTVPALLAPFSPTPNVKQTSCCNAARN
jgi:hypothetical protein